MNKFIKDLEYGLYFETELLKHIPYKSYEQSKGNFKPYDIKIFKKNGFISTYEVKADRQINIHGNICIEYECRNKPSGITTSTAKYWAIFEVITMDKYALYKIPRKRILKDIENNMYKRKCVGGDNKASNLYLFDKNLYKKYIIYTNI
jgi:hypothetical protein